MADRHTVQIGGDGTDTIAYTLPPGVLQYVQSVLVNIDNTAGGDATPLLTVQTVNQLPVADQMQGSAIPGGDTGRATWALRLAGEGGGGGRLSLLGFAKYSQLNRSINSGVATSWSWTLVDGSELFDQTNPLSPVVLTAGLYVFTAHVSQSAGIVAGKHSYSQLKAVDGVSGNDKFVSQITGYVDDSPLVSTQTIKPTGFAAYLAAGDFVQARIQHDEGVAKNWSWSLWVQVLG